MAFGEYEFLFALHLHQIFYWLTLLGVVDGQVNEWMSLVVNSH